MPTCINMQEVVKGIKISLFVKMDILILDVCSDMPNDAYGH